VDFALRAAAFHFLVIAANGRSQFFPETGLGRFLPVFAFWQRPFTELQRANGIIVESGHAADVNPLILQE
jgi:hypothetical protein